MDKKLPYIDENGQLHYEAYYGMHLKSILRQSLPKDHPENLYNYLKRHGIDWTLYFEEDGRRKGIDHEHGPLDKLFGLMPDKRRCEYEYTEEDMKAAFNGGAANSAKLRVSDNKLTLPVLEFNQWLDKYKNRREPMLIVNESKGVGKSLDTLKFVMLPTKGKSPIYKAGEKLFFDPEKRGAGETEGYVNQHLYLIEKLKVKAGDFALLDWEGNMNPGDLRVGEVLEITDNKIKIKNQFGRESHTSENYPNAKWYKIVATTDDFPIAQLSLSLVDFYTVFYNAGTPFKEAVRDGKKIKPLFNIQ